MPNWYPGQNAQGYKTEPQPVLFAATPQFQKGQVSTPPGTAGPGTAVVNNTGYDCLVYVSSTQGLSGISTTQGTVSAGTVPAFATTTVFVPAGYSITLTSANTSAVTWHWLAL
jgi:hypothetical protein